MNYEKITIGFGVFYLTFFTHALKFHNETEVLASCPKKHFACAKGGCIQELRVCNGYSDCVDGSDESPDACVSVSDCGQGDSVWSLSLKEGKAHESAFGGQPWHAAIYKITKTNGHHTLICAGTLIHLDIVLTSASCLTDPSRGVETFFPTLIRVNFGKLRKGYDKKEIFQQEMKVKKIIVLNNYKGELKTYSKNLAIIQLTDKVEQSEFVNPACLWTHDFIPRGIKSGAIWGWSLENSMNPLVLQESLVTLRTAEDCIRKFKAPYYSHFITNDKFCFDFEKGITLKDHSGGGGVMTFYNGRMFVIGVISVQPPKADQFGICTKVTSHLKWIKKTIRDLKTTDNCLKEEGNFICDNGLQCLEENRICDGQEDCNDKSDEDVNICHKMKTAELATLSECGRPDSAEKFNLLKCGDQSGCKSNFSIPSNSKYQITCPEGMAFADPSHQVKLVVCSDGEWVPSLEETKCLKLCPGIDYPSLELECLYRESAINCNQPIRPNTIVKIKCKRHYKKANLVNYVSKTRCNEYGYFDHDISAECIPICGKPFENQAQKLISLGEDIKYAKYPWHVGLYWRNLKDFNETSEVVSYKCGGTLIDPNKVLTAAHCIWDDVINAKKNASDVLVALGKYYLRWNSKQDAAAVHMEVSKILTAEHYNGIQSKYADDLAVLVLEREVGLSDYIMPACLDLIGLNGGIPSHQLGHVVGWGAKLENSRPSEVLQEAWLSYIDLITCRKSFTSFSFIDFMHSDKFCVAYRNGTGTQQGDSGGGMTFLHDKLHYVYGVISVKKTKQNEFAVFTNILAHKDWLLKILKDF